MKHETKAKLDKIVPLLAHWMEGGKFKMTPSGSLCGRINLDAMINSPEAYVIHVEPMVVYIPDYSGQLSVYSYPTEANARQHIGLNCDRIRRFVEDLDWKPEDHTPPNQ